MKSPEKNTFVRIILRDSGQGLIVFAYPSACDQYSVPHHVKEHIELITPTLHFDAKIEPIKPPRRKRDNVPVQGASRNIGQPGVGNSPKTTGKISNIIDQLENCDKQITPNCLRALYDVVYKPVSTKKNSYGIGTHKSIQQTNVYDIKHLLKQLNTRLRHSYKAILVGTLTTSVDILLIFL